MISVVFGGVEGDKDFELWLKSKCKFVRRFNVMKRGDLAKFSSAVQESCLKIVHKDMYGKIIGSNKANDSYLVHINEVDGKVESDIVMKRVQAYCILVEDAELDIQVFNYDSELGRAWAPYKG